SAQRRGALAGIPQLPEALASRFQIEHHAVMVAQLLAHIDTLDAAVQNLSERIEFVLAPHQHVVELLSMVPGVQAHAAQVLIAECGLDMTLGSRPSGTSHRGPESIPAITNQPAADAAGEPALSRAGFCGDRLRSMTSASGRRSFVAAGAT